MNKWLRRILKGLRILVGAPVVQVIGLVVFVQLTWNRPVSRPVPEMTAPIDAGTVARGEYLYNYTLNCWTCHGSQGSHGPGEPQAGGREFDAADIGPGFGFLYAAIVGANTGEYDMTQPFAGRLFPIPEEGFSTAGSNLTPDVATGIGGWTEEQYMTAMRTGLRPDGTVMLPFMPWPAYAQWSEEDLRAVWLYLRSLEPIAHEVPASTLTGVAATGTGAERGKALYGMYCVMCHGEKGAGGPLAAVPLKGVAQGMDDAGLTWFIAEGLSGTSMPGFGKTLTAEQMADLVAFIRTW